MALTDGCILLCGRYRGVDERVVDALVDEEMSVGDYVLSGGELAAMALMDAVLRHRPVFWATVHLLMMTLLPTVCWMSLVIRDRRFLKGAPFRALCCRAITRLFYAGGGGVL